LVVFGKLRKKDSGKEAISPAISSVIMMGAMVAILSVALVFANNILWSRVAEGEFDSSKQFMQSVGLQIDDVAWTVGRTETIRYSSQYGEVVLESSALTYNVTVNGELEQYVTGALMFNVPISRYSITNDYFERIFPYQDESLTLTGTSAPVARVFVVEKLPMADGSYIRVVVVPAIRVLYSDITSGTPPTTTHYIRMYLPVLSAGEAPRLSQSITLSGESLNAYTVNGVTSINVAVGFQEDSIFDFAFSNFPFDSVEDISVDFGDDDVVLEFYLSEVSVDFGLNY
jgi:hypothetical protein